MYGGENKKRKLKNSYCVGGALKEKKLKVKVQVLTKVLKFDIVYV